MEQNQQTKERPILFSGAMVRAILEGKKTQTRRGIKHSDGDQQIFWNPIVVNGYAGWVNEHGRPRPCPYGKPGDRLWVRETWNSMGGFLTYRADGEKAKDDAAFKWKPSIFMPRWASRLTLEITDVRIERLNGITETDARAEGMPLDDEFPLDDWLGGWRSGFPCWQCRGQGLCMALGEDYGVIEVDCDVCETLQKRFKLVWESIYGPDSFDDRLVWAVSFKRLEEHGN